MKSLVESNPYLRDPKKRRQMLEESTRDSFAFEGIRVRTAGRKHAQRPKRLSMASAKKAASKS